METLFIPTLTQNPPIRKQVKSTAPDRILLLGYLLLAVSTGLYGLEEYLNTNRTSDDFNIFFIHYFIALGYVIALLLNKSYGIRKSWRAENIHKTVVLLNLFLVSAYALNRPVPVFEDSATWLCVYLILTSIVTVSYQYFDTLHKAVNYIQHIVLGSAFVLYLYLSIYVANFYFIGTIGILFFGIGAHIFLPLLLLIASARLLSIAQTKQRISIAWVISGGLTTLGFTAAYVTEWNDRVKAIDRMANQSVIYTDTELPVWVKVAQTVKNDWLTEHILKSKLIYTISNNDFGWSRFPTRSWNEQRIHDPLVFIASSTNNTALDIDDRITILKALTNGRHLAEEQLWSGDNLSTSYIVSDIDVYSDLRIAYTEHYLNIRNNTVSNSNWRGANQEEAIYTFQLPEGSVVTSLSLWINGVEEKAILTSKQKATEAYTTIVGRELRDPSVVHWQEGNTVTVRIFPCTPDEERKFKIGITSPLVVSNSKAIYENVTFRGPNASSATQTIRVRVVGNSQNIDLPRKFEKTANGGFISEGKYDDSFAVELDLTSIRPNQFSFDGFTYSLSEINHTVENIEFQKIYLDINNSWSNKEIELIRPIIQDYKVYAYLENDFIALTTDNWDEVTAALQEHNFTLFPFHHLKNTSAELVITKGKKLSPHLVDFKASSFAEAIGRYFASDNKAYVFNLEGGTSTYIKSLKEFRAFHFAQGTPKDILDFLHTKTFPIAKENDHQVVLHESGLTIKKTPLAEGQSKNTAPDHLARLFAYNNIMQQVGANYFKDDFINEKLVKEAASAYVVSPVSSLIVLETKQDYERFDIKDTENSLHNASKNSSGAVPEPHEWALIIVFLLLVIFYVRRYKLKLACFQK